MKRSLCKALCILLAITMLCGVPVTAFAADGQDGTLTACGGDCEYCPSVVIPGVFQSQTRMYDENGDVVLDKDGKPLTQLFVNVSTKDIVRYAAQAILPLTASLVLQRDVGLSKTVARIVTDVLGNNAKDNEGRHIENIDVIRYPMSVARCTPEGKEYIYRTIPLEHYSEIAGEDHLYFFTYDSFASVSELADELYAFIQNVKKETGHDKINLVPISQGGSIANELLERYRDELARDLNRLIYIVPAVDGSYVIGKIFSGTLTLRDTDLYRDMFPRLFKDEDEKATAYGVNLAIRLLPKNTVHNIINRTVDELRNSILVNATCMWALTPSSEYDTLYARYLAGGEREKLREELEFFHKAQLNAVDNMLYLQEKGVEVFDLCNYDVYFYPIIDGWETYNADGVIQLDSTSIGATSCPIHETLPADYVQKNTYCTCGGNHISPDRKVDASTGALCETTFYFDEGDHERTGGNDVIIGLAVALLTDENFKDVHTYPDKYPQFNTARVTKNLRGTLDWARKIDPASLPAEGAAELAAAIQECDDMLAETVVDLDKTHHAEQRLDDILIKIGKKEPPKEPTAAQKALGNLMQKLSDRAYKTIGPRGFSDALLFRGK